VLSPFVIGRREGREAARIVGMITTVYAVPMGLIAWWSPTLRPCEEGTIASVQRGVRE